jgi:hypothetical protein
VIRRNNSSFITPRTLHSKKRERKDAGDDTDTEDSVIDGALDEHEALDEEVEVTMNDFDDDDDDLLFAGEDADDDELKRFTVEISGMNLPPRSLRA